MVRDTLRDENEENRTSETVTRRRTLGALGTGLLTAGTIGSAGTVTADTHDAEVWQDGGTWYATNGESTVYDGGDMFAAIQTAIDSLSSGRNAKETVIVRDGGTASGQLTLPSYTVLDMRGTITHAGEIPIYADGAHAIEIPNYSVTGSPDMGIRLQRCSDVVLGSISVEGAGIGIRIDNAYETGNAVTTETVRLESAEVTGTGSHGVETYGVDDIEIGTVVARDTGGCGLLLNDTSNATVDRVDATRADEGGGYAGFRCANDAGPNIHVNEVRSVDCGRGVFTVSGSHGITIEDVSLEGNGGNLIQDSRNVQINGGIVENNGGEGFRIDSRDSGDHPHTRDVTIQNVGIYNHDYGVRETGPDTENNAILDNDFCDNGIDIETYASSTVVDGNTYCQGNAGGDDSGTDGSISTGTYRITNVNSGLFLEVGGADTSDGANVQQWSDTGHACQEWYVEDTGNGEYLLQNEHSGLLLEVEDSSTEDGANVQQHSDTGCACQRWYITDEGNGEYALEAVHSGSLADVESFSTSDGANVIQWPDTGGTNQRWTFDEV